MAIAAMAMALEFLADDFLSLIVFGSFPSFVYSLFYLCMAMAMAVVYNYPYEMAIHKYIYIHPGVYVYIYIYITY